MDFDVAFLKNVNLRPQRRPSKTSLKSLSTTSYIIMDDFRSRRHFDPRSSDWLEKIQPSTYQGFMTLISFLFYRDLKACKLLHFFLMNNSILSTISFVVFFQYLQNSILISFQAFDLIHLFWVYSLFYLQH